MTRCRTLFAVTCCALLIAGCNGGSSSPKAKSTPKPTPLTVAQAKLLAAAGVVAAADLPGYTSEDQKADPTDAADQAKFDACVGVPVVTYLAEDEGKSYTTGELEIDSSASVMTTAAMAKGEVDAAAGAKGPDCFKQVVVASAAGDVTNPQVTITPQTVIVPGADSAVIYAIRMSGTSGGQRIEVRGSQALAVVGQTVIDIGSFATSPPLFSNDEMIGLLTKAAARVKAAS